MNETHLYIRQRLEVAGNSHNVSFSNSAVNWVYIATRGVPRMINILCDRSLLIAYGDERRRITSGIVIRGIWEILNRSLVRKTNRLIYVIIFLLIILTCLLSAQNTLKSKGRTLSLFSTPSGFNSLYKLPFPKGENNQ